MAAKLRERAEKHEKWAAENDRQAEEMEAAGTNELLHKRLRSSSVNEPTMEKGHRLAISEGHRGEDVAFRKAIHAKGYSQNGLAKKLRLNQAILSLHRRGVRKIPLSRAKAIEALTGWPADEKHWPVGIVSDGE